MLQSDEIGSKFATTKALQEAMTKDSVLFQKVQEEILKVGDKTFETLKEEIKERADLITDAQEREEFELKHAEKLLKLQEETTNNLQDNLSNLIENEKSTKKIKDNFKNVKDLVDDLGNKLRNPSQAAEGMLSSLGKIPMYLQKAQKEGKSFGTIVKDVGLLISGKFAKAAALLFTPTGLLILGISLAVAALTTLYKLFSNYWEFLDKKIMPAQAEFNREIGGTGKATAGLKSQMNSAGVEMELLGYSFEEGASMIRDFSKAANTGLTIPKDVLKTGKELTFVLGLTAEQSGKLVQQFQKQGAGMGQLNEMFKVGSKEAKAYGLPVNDVLRDMGDAPDILARFGVANRKEFAVSAAKARSYGLSIKELNAAFGKQLDTFEGSSMAAGKLNAVFGTNINSLKLMMEHDPTKRMEMLRGSLLKQGKDWEHLSVAERNVITQTLGVDEAQAQLVLSSDKVRKSLEAQAVKKRQAAKADERWNEGLRSIQKTLLNWGAQLDKVMRKVSDLVSRIFGFEDGSDVVQSFVDLTVSGLDKVSGAIDWADETLTSIRKGLKDGGEDFGFFGKMAVLAFKSLKLGASIVIKPFEIWWSWTKKVVGMVGSLFETIIEGWKNIGSWIGPIIDHLSGNKLGSFDMEGFGKSIVTDLNKGIDEAMDTISDDNEIIAPKIIEPSKVESKAPKKAELERSKKKAKVIDKEKVAKLKEDKKKQEDESHKKLANAIGDAISKKTASNGPMEMIIRDVSGNYFGKAVVKGARGGMT